MKTLTRNTMQLLLISVLSVPLAVLAADKPDEAHDSHHPAVTQTSDAAAQTTPISPDLLRDRMETRLRAMQQVNDSQARLSMMMAQMQDINDMMKAMGAGCPMMEGMMGGGETMPGHRGAGVPEKRPSKPAK